MAKRMFEKSCQCQVHRTWYRLHASSPEAEVSTYSTEFDGSQDFSNTLSNQPQLHLAGFADHVLVPRRIPHQLYVSAFDDAKLVALGFDEPCELAALVTGIQAATISAVRATLSILTILPLTAVVR